MPEDGKLEQSDCYSVKLGDAVTKDDAIYAVLSNIDFMKFCGYSSPVHSIDQLKMVLDLMDIKYD